MEEGTAMRHKAKLPYAAKTPVSISEFRHSQHTNNAHPANQSYNNRGSGLESCHGPLESNALKSGTSSNSRLIIAALIFAVGAKPLGVLPRIPRGRRHTNPAARPKSTRFQMSFSPIDAGMEAHNRGSIFAVAHGAEKLDCVTF